MNIHNLRQESKNTSEDQAEQCSSSVDTRRRVNVDTTLYNVVRCRKRHIDVETTSCVYKGDSYKNLFGGDKRNAGPFQVMTLLSIKILLAFILRNANYK